MPHELPKNSPHKQRKSDKIEKIEIYGRHPQRGAFFIAGEGIAVANGKLTPKQERFIDEYLIDLNATAAYLRAGYQCTDETARRNGSLLLTNTDIYKRIEERKAARVERVEVTQDFVLKNLVDLVNNCMEKDENGRVYNASAANKTLELLGKHLGMFTDKAELTGANGTPLIPEIPRIAVRIIDSKDEIATDAV